MQSDDEQAIRRLIATWVNATNAGDTRKVLGLMADDVVFLVAGKPPMRGKAAFSSAQAGTQQADIYATSEIQEVKVFGDWAYAWTKLSVDTAPKGSGGSVKLAGYTLSVFNKQQGGWVLFRDANLLAPVP